MNGPINKGVSSALLRVFSRRSAILKIVEEKALGTRLLNDLDFDRYKVGSIKRSSCVGERMRASLNQLLN